MMRRWYLGGLAVAVCMLVSLSACGGSGATSAPAGGGNGATSAPATSAGGGGQATSASTGSTATSAPAGGGSAATAAPAGGGSAGTTVNVQEKDFVITLDKTSAPAGSITFKMTNMGPSPHNIAIITPDGASKASGVTGMPIKMGDQINAGQSQSITVDLKPGMYSVVCTVPGHVQLGMIVPFTVS